MNASKIDNPKIPIYHCLNGTLHTFTLTLNVYAGLLYEGENENGLTHLLEHCVFRNLNRIYNGRPYAELEKRGLEFNGSTYREFLRFDISGLTGGYGFALEIFAHIFDDIDLSKEEFDKEKGRIRAEIMEADEKNSIDHLIQSTVWHGTPLERTISGNVGRVNGYSRKRLNEYAKKILSSGNMFIVLTGSIPDNGLELLREAVGKLNINENPSDLPKNTAALPCDFMRRPAVVNRKYSDWCCVGFSFDIDNKKIPLNISNTIYDILFSGSDDMMYTKFSEDTGLIYSYDSYFEAYRNCTEFVFNFEIEKKHLERAISTVIDILRDRDTYEEGFENVKIKKLNEVKKSIDDPDTLNFNIAWDVMLDLFKEGDPVENTRASLEGVSRVDIVSAAEKIFRPENMTLVLRCRKCDTDEIYGLCL
ncbi:MAG: insulinase family protein [Clostridia bacterium]|nr:insulinase family protein [Clostridia bacterium]